MRKPLLGAYVMERLAYIDSIFVRSTRKLEPGYLQRLKDSLVPDPRFPWERYFGDKWEYVNLDTGEIFFHYVHLIHQPTKAALGVLQEIQDEQPDVLHLLDVHFALDLTTGSEADAMALHEAILSVYTPARLALTGRESEHETSYVGRRRSGNEVGVYSDGKRKVRPNTPRVHLEWRIHGATALRRSGIRTASDLTRIDHRAFWKKRLRLHIMPTMDRLLRLLELRAARRGHPLSPERRAHTLNMISRFSKDYTGRFSAHYLDYYLHLGLHPKPAQLYKRLSNDWALPEPSNALWNDGLAGRGSV
ncbi:hypothetical protein [Hydrogenophaga laconesensis]|uniref:Uncharacterized protein n=1 Tax=Hydrogenophaga laconesensis TaxID=1805971 RepID=A0ABU1VJJ1_9BURK|nr:hypothetical protein [Hydrogenophaga laconesensis]MDR7097333.1 hypothetical protein [Hydrogenophaga laconesensis]